VLFSGTIQENILYGFNIKSYTDKQVEEMMDEACRLSNAYNFIHEKEQFPIGY
jgi:ABC-type multidrug transport system fused ATPase/permease subunit